MTAHMADHSAKENYGRKVPAVDRSAQLLFTLANSVSGDSVLTKLAGKAGISRSKALAVLNTLCLVSLVARNDKTKRYCLGLNILVLSRALINQEPTWRARRSPTWSSWRMRQAPSSVWVSYRATWSMS